MLGVALYFAVLVGLMGTIGGASDRSRHTVPWAGFLGGVVAFEVVMCPVTGHHTVGAWWGIELALVVAMLVTTGLALRSLRRS
jgi:hypothetical protein